MNTKIYIGIIAALIVLAGGAFFFINQNRSEQQSQIASETGPAAPEERMMDAQDIQSFEAVQENAPAFSDGGKPEGWQTYNYTTLGSSQQLSFYVPPLGEYCNGCIDQGGVPNVENSSLLTISGGNTEQQTNTQKWRLYVYDTPSAEALALVEKTEKMYEVDLGDRKITFAFHIYDPAFEGLFDAIQQSIIFEHRPDAELPL